MDKDTLSGKKLDELKGLATEVGVKNISRKKKSELIDAIIEQIEVNEQENQESQEQAAESSQKEPLKVKGILDLHQDGFGFLRSEGYDSGDDDIYVPHTQVRRFRLKTGDYVEGLAREKHDEREKFCPLIYINKVNGDGPENLRERRNFEDLTPLYPEEKINLEWGKDQYSMRIINLISPIGKGQRGLIVSPPKTGKTTLLKSIANAIGKNHPEMHIIVLLIDERPEEVTDMKRSVDAEVVASTFDELPQNHTRISEIVLERAKRLVEHGRDVVILTDSITRLSRAYNITSPYSGKTLSGGLDPMALHKPKRFFGAARNLEEGGSLTIIATALIETGSRMDDMIYEEFKGTGNMEVHLDRDLSELRIFPAIDIYKSGTRKDEILLTEDEVEAMRKIRRFLSSGNAQEVADKFQEMIHNTKSNQQLLNEINKGLK
ncbi:MAG: transcription termination factor Rho [Gallicola sp.]|nr:transcription termination factor Rho [Gallicola sp.]